MLQENVYDVDKKRNKPEYKIMCVCACVFLYICRKRYVQKKICTHTFICMYVYIYTQNTQCDSVLVSCDCYNKLLQTWMS